MIDVVQANQEAVGRMMATRPMLTTLGRAGDVVSGMRPDLLLHAGPPIEWERMSGPLRGAIIGALILEGRATDDASAVALVEAGEVDFEPCHHHGVVGPMAGVTSSSMMVYVLEDEESGTRAFSTLNEGYGKVLRYGAYSEEVLEKLRWMNGLYIRQLPLDRLVEASPGCKRKILTAYAHAAASDGQLMPAEAELLRAVADTMDCPMPPVPLGVGEPTAVVTRSN